MIKILLISLLEFVVGGINVEMASTFEYRSLITYTYSDFRPDEAVYVKNGYLPYQLITLDENATGKLLMQTIIPIQKKGNCDILCCMGTRMVDISTYGLEDLVLPYIIENEENKKNYPLSPVENLCTIPINGIPTTILFISLNSSNIEQINKTLSDKETFNNVGLIFSLSDDVPVYYLFDVLTFLKQHSYIHGVLLLSCSNNKQSAPSKPIMVSPKWELYYPD